MSATTQLPPPYTDEQEISRARAAVEQLVCGLPGVNPSEMSFEHPWEIRAFGMAVAAHERLGFDWSLFQHALITSIQAWERAGHDAAQWSYYEHWVTALETVMTSVGVIDGGELDAHTADVLAVPPNRGHHDAHTEPIAIDPARPHSHGI